MRLLITGTDTQVGKTTILQHLSEKERTYITLDDPLLAQLAREEPRLFLQRFTPPILIDEIQALQPESVHSFPSFF